MKNSILNKRALIIGCGSIGERHLHNLKNLGFYNIAIFDKDKSKTKAISKKFKTKSFYNLKSSLSFNPDFSIICTTPKSHLYLANECIMIGSHVFIEKPLSNNLDKVDKILKKADSKKLKVAVGYNLRFDKGLNFIKKTLKKEKVFPLSILSQWGHNIKFWKQGTDYKSHYILKKNGGIVLDDSHEYDYLRWLLDDEVVSVYSQTKKTTTIKTQTESIAAIILKFRKGTIASILMDYVRPNYERTSHIISEKGDVRWSFVPKKGSWKNYKSKAFSNVTMNLFNKSIRKKFLINTNDMYLAEISDFLQCIEKNKKPIIDGWDALKTLKIGMAILESSKKNIVVNIS